MKRKELEQIIKEKEEALNVERRKVDEAQMDCSQLGKGR